MKRSSLVAAVLVVAAISAGEARASAVTVNAVGSGITLSLVLTYGPATDSVYPQAFEVTGINGTFTDTNNGLDFVNAPVGPLVPITHDMPEPDNKLAPHDFSRFAVASGLPADNGGVLTYDNLYYPGGSPQTATSYTAAGGILDIYGLMFQLPGGDVVDFWSNGNGPNGVADYGVAVATSARSLDYESGGISVPEPGSLGLLGAGLLGLIARRRRSR